MICPQVFDGNFDRNTTVKRILCNSFLARSLRIIAQEKHDRWCMRVEIYGVPRRQGDFLLLILIIRVWFIFLMSSNYLSYVDWFSESGNLAYKKPTSQSSTCCLFWSQSESHYAVDGDRDTFVTNCALTDFSKTDPWWRVDFERSQPVSDLYIVNILDTGGCCGVPLQNFEIRVGEYGIERNLSRRHTVEKRPSCSFLRRV